MTVSRISLCW